VVLACALPGVAAAAEPKPWCAPEVTELSSHVCYFEGPTPADGRRTLVIYLHGMLADTPGFAWLQHRAMAIHAKRLNFTVLMPTSPKEDGAFVWPTSEAAIKEQEPAIVAGIAKARAELVARVGHDFDETFVVGFSSGAYYGSAAALRGAIPSDGTIVLAGGSAWARAKADGPRAPVFVGVSAADRQTREHSRAFGNALNALHWPHRTEEQNAGHMVDWALITHGLAWLRSQSPASASAPAEHHPLRTQ
jgi:predicted esterase